MSSPFDLSGKLALITGASRGIGAGIARGLAHAGANVILVARGEAELEAVAAALRLELSARAEFHNVWTSICDIGELARLPGWYAEQLSQYGTPQILINAAGTTRRGMALEQPLTDFEYLQRVNVTATYELARLFARELVAKNLPGKVVNIASLMTFASRPGTAAYTASKGAVGQLTKALAIEWAKHRIQVNAIAPGYIATSLTQPLVADPQFTAWVEQRCPTGRWGTPDDLAGPAVFLSSAASDFVTGQILAVDGGWLAGL